MASDVTINVTVEQGGTIDADLDNATTINTEVVEGGQIEAAVTGGGTGAKGDQGDQGIQGIQGIQGNTGAGVPNGGSVGQVLAKLSGTDQDTAWHTPVKADVGLSNADNTSDANKPVSTAQGVAIAVVQSDIDTHEANTSNPHSVTKTQVGLANVDNLQQQPIDADLTAIAALDSSTAGAMATDGAGWIRKTYAQLKTAMSFVKGDVGLGNVDNTSDASKPISTLTQTALDAKVTGVASVTDDLPAIFDGTTGKLIKSKTYAAFKTLLVLVKGDVGLGNVDNTADASKPVSTAQAAADAAVAAAAQPLDSDLTTIAGLTPTTDNFMLATASAWASRTPAQARSQMGLGTIALLSTITEANITLADNTTNNFTTSAHGFVPKGTNTGKFLKDDGTWDAIPGGGDALTSSSLAQFAATTSAQLAGIMTNETGSGALVFGTAPALSAPTGLVKGDVGLGNVDNTSDATKNAASVTLTNKTLTSPVVNTPTGIVKGDVGLGNVDNTSNATERAASATLTNKTLTSPVINTPTGIVKGDVGLGNVDNTSNATERAAAATLTNKTIDTPILRAWNGWVDANETWTYASGTGTNYGTFTVAGIDLTGKYQAGMKIKMTQTTVKYGIITKVAFSTDTTITVYFGTDYTIANAAISANYYSSDNNPFGFPRSPEKWTIVQTSTTGRSTTSTTLASLTDDFVVPIGAWRIMFDATIQITSATTTSYAAAVLLSSDASTATNPNLIMRAYQRGAAAATNHSGARQHVEDFVLLAASTTYRMMGCITTNTGTVNVANTAEPASIAQPTIWRAVCAYL